MPPKILFFIIFLAVLMFFPLTKITATNVYVGVQIAATEPLNSSSQPDPGKLWCMGVGTTVGVLSGAPPGTSYLTPVSQP